MALYKTLTVNKTTKVLIWKIEESIAELKENTQLSKKSETRLNSMRSELHQKGFLSIRHSEIVLYPPLAITKSTLFI